MDAVLRFALGAAGVDQAVEMLNKFKLFGPLMDFYGFK